MRNLLRLRCLLLLVGLLAISSAAPAQMSVGVSIRVGPPPLPVYVQPVCPGDGFIWSPGYWAWGPDGYFWVPGTWVRPPRVGVLWTPGYWGWGEGVYVWHAGYWGPHIGFYGGINYGFGYGGVGYEGGYWERGAFVYNRAVNNVNVTVIHNTYNKTVVNNVTVNRVSYNGGTGGIGARPNPAEQAAIREQHVAATAEQSQHERASGSNRALLASSNHGQPPVAATPRAGAFSGNGVVAARGAAAPNARADERAAPRTVNAGANARPNAAPQRNVQEQPRANRPPPKQPQGESRPKNKPQPREGREKEGR